MRIAVLTSAHSCLDARIVHKQAVSLARLGHQVTVIAPDEPGPQAVPGIGFTGLGTEVRGIASRASLLPKLLAAALRSGADIYSCHEPESALVGLAARARTGARVVFDVHEWFDETLPQRLGGWKGRAVRWLSRRLLHVLGRRANWITTVSPPLADFYRALRHDGRVDLLYNAPTMDRFPLCDQADRQELLVCHEGIISPGRGLEQMLEALAIARKDADVRLQLIGRLNPASSEVYDRKVAALALGDAVAVSGWLPYAQVGPRLARGQVGTVALQPSPNNYGGLGNKVFNYMCCGLACVVPAGSATADMVRQADCGLPVDTTNPKAIAAAWVRLAGDGALRRRLGANGRRAIEEKFGWHRMEQVLARVYGGLAGKEPAEA